MNCNPKMMMMMSFKAIDIINFVETKLRINFLFPSFYQDDRFETKVILVCHSVRPNAYDGKHQEYFFDFFFFGAVDVCVAVKFLWCTAGLYDLIYHSIIYTYIVCLCLSATTSSSYGLVGLGTFTHCDNESIDDNLPFELQK